MTTNQFLSTGAVAARLGVSKAVVRKLPLNPVRVDDGRGGTRLYYAEEVERYARALALVRGTR